MKGCLNPLLELSVGDAGKSDAHRYCLDAYLVGKALSPEATRVKPLQYIITAGAALLNCHGARVGACRDMRPSFEAGIEGASAPIDAQAQAQKGGA